MHGNPERVGKAADRIEARQEVLVAAAIDLLLNHNFHPPPHRRLFSTYSCALLRLFQNSPVSLTQSLRHLRLLASILANRTIPYVVCDPLGKCSVSWVVRALLQDNTSRLPQLRHRKSFGARRSSGIRWPIRSL